MCTQYLKRKASSEVQDSTILPRYKSSLLWGPWTPIYADSGIGATRGDPSAVTPSIHFVLIVYINLQQTDKQTEKLEIIIKTIRLLRY